MAHLPKGQGVVPMPPFLGWLANNIPAVYDNTMSYYEELVSLIKYLQDTVIPALNANSEAITVISNAVEQLQKYVDDYFKNLDVQEEINNKLDEMAEDGTLQEIITAYIQANVAWTFDTVADMKSATNLIDGSFAQTLGYRTANDGGAALYRISDTGTANEMDVIAVGDLFATIVTNGTINPDQLGAYGDGQQTHDDSVYIQRALDMQEIVEFSPKTYMCFSLVTNYPVVLHGNGATLKRPELDIAPYNKTVAQMKWINTLRVRHDAVIDNLIFDNNCFTMWQPSDGYTQEQSSALICASEDAKIKVNVTNCKFKNSASDGLHIVQNIIANVSNCISEDCFRGGLTTTGFGSEINVDGWNSKVKTAGVHDGFDCEVDSASTVDPETYILNINNAILDYDLDIVCPNHGTINLNNITMRKFDDTTLHGFMIGTKGGCVNVSNCILRNGVNASTQTYVHDNGEINFSNCQLYGNATDALFKVTQYQETMYNSKISISNCTAKCYNFLQVASFTGSITIDDCNIECTNQCVIKLSPNDTQVSDGLKIQNSSIKFGDRFINFTKNQYAPNGSSKLYLSNLKLSGNAGSDVYLAGTPDIYFNNLVMEAGCVSTIGGGSTIHFYGQGRIILVPTATDLTFKGWVAGDDIAIALDTGTKYRYTSGTTWTAI